jgi:hypothetical protein
MQSGSVFTKIAGEPDQTRLWQHNIMNAIGNNIQGIINCHTALCTVDMLYGLDLKSPQYCTLAGNLASELLGDIM